MDDDELKRLAEEDFFVGYLPMSGAQKRFGWTVAVAAVLVVLAGGVAAAFFEKCASVR